MGQVRGVERVSSGLVFFFFSSRRRHTRCCRDWSSDVCSSDLLAERPLNLHRFPNGPDGPGFWQKDLKPTDPSWLRRWREVGVEAREANEHVVADRVATLAWLGNQAAFEVHAWTSRLDAPFRPTFALIDIDPGTKTTWEETLTIARLYRTAPGHLGVRGYPKGPSSEER